jgi:hypothetical protein
MLDRLSGSTKDPQRIHKVETRATNAQHRQERKARLLFSIWSSSSSWASFLLHKTRNMNPVYLVSTSKAGMTKSMIQNQQSIKVGAHPLPPIPSQIPTISAKGVFIYHPFAHSHTRHFTPYHTELSQIKWVNGVWFSCKDEFERRGGLRSRKLANVSLVGLNMPICVAQEVDFLFGCTIKMVGTMRFRAHCVPPMCKRKEISKRFCSIDDSLYRFKNFWHKYFERIIQTSKMHKHSIK